MKVKIILACWYDFSNVVASNFNPPSQKTMGLSPWMNATVGPSEAQRAKEGASADSAEEEMKDTTGVKPWRLHEQFRVSHLGSRLAAWLP